MHFNTAVDYNQLLCLCMIFRWRTLRYINHVAVIEADSCMTFSKPVLLSHCTEFAINSEFLTFPPAIYHSHQPVLVWSVNQASLRDEHHVAQAAGDRASRFGANCRPAAALRSSASARQ